MKDKKTFLFAFKATLPVLAGYFVLGAGLGMLFVSKGYDWWWAPLSGVVIYAGSMQFVALDLLTSGASLVTAALMALAVNFRHLFYGVSMLEKYRGTGAAKPYLIYSLSDETFSLVCSPDIPEGVDRKRYYLLVSLLDQLYWVAGSLIGALAGGALTFNTEGIDFAMTALFVVIFVEQWEKADSHLPALTGLGISLVCLLIFGASAFLIPALLIITAALFAEKRAITGVAK